VITIELLLALTLMLGIFNAIAQPSRLALIPTLVDRAALPSALAINAIIFNSARFLGPAVAGIVIAQISVGATFAVNAATYVVFLVAMTNLRGLPALPVGATQSVLKARSRLISTPAGIQASRPMLLLFTITTIGTRGLSSSFPVLPTASSGAAPRLGDADLDGRPWRHLRCGLDAAAAGDRRADPGSCSPTRW